jgi:hypothetical protein
MSVELLMNRGEKAAISAPLNSLSGRKLLREANNISGVFAPAGSGRIQRRYVAFRTKLILSAEKMKGSP